MPTSALNSILDTSNELRSKHIKSEPQPTGYSLYIRPKTSFTKDQISTLEDSFMKNNYPSMQDMLELSIKVNVERQKIKTWFQNKRTKLRREGKLVGKHSRGRGIIKKVGLVDKDLKYSTPNALPSAPVHERVVTSQYSLQSPQKTTPILTDDVGFNFKLSQYSEVSQIGPMLDLQNIQTVTDYLGLDLDDFSSISYDLLIANIFAREKLFSIDHCVPENRSCEGSCSG